MPVSANELVDVEFDFVSHELVFRRSSGQIARMGLHPQSVASFFQKYRETLHALGLDLDIAPKPVEVKESIAFDQDTKHCSYDRDAVGRFWQVLIHADTLLKRFSTNFYGKISPVHFFWGSFDLAVTRFSGRRAPARPESDSIQTEAYSHEVISAGFWPGNGGYGQPAFYCYAAPVPVGLSEVKLTSKGSFNAALGEFVIGLRGDSAVRRSGPDGP